MQFIFPNSPLNLTSPLPGHLSACTDCALTVHRLVTQHHAWYTNHGSDQLGNVLGNEEAALPRRQLAGFEVELITGNLLLAKSSSLFSSPDQISPNYRYNGKVRDEEDGRRRGQSQTQAVGVCCSSSWSLQLLRILSHSLPT